MMKVKTSIQVAAPPETVFGVYADYRIWPWLFPTIRAVRLIRRDGPKLVLEVDHVEGQVVNELVLSPPQELRLWEEKRRYDALFVNRFDPIPSGTRFTATGIIRLKGAGRLLRPFLGGLARRRMQRLQLQPVKIAAEARSACPAPGAPRPPVGEGGGGA